MSKIIVVLTINLIWLSLLCQGQNIVDFTLVQYDQQQAKASRPKQNVNIKPNPDVIQGFSFPQACFFARKLQEEKIEDSREIANYDLDSMMDDLKIDFVDLLKISQKIKKKRSNIQQLSQMSGRSFNVTVVKPKQLQALKQQQDKLNSLDNQIQQKSQEIQRLVKQSLINSGSNQFALSSVNFEIQSLKLKLDYLRRLKKKSGDAELSQAKDQYEKYFSDLRIKFDQQNDLIDDLNAILKSFNQIGELRAKIQNLKGKIDIAKLMIQQKQACAKQKDQIRNFQKQTDQIKTHMANLRQKKKDRNNINNKYCEGVAKKLQDRIKKVLLSYDYTFQCAEGLLQMNDQKREDQIQMNKAQQRLRQLQNSAGIDNYKRKFDSNRQYIKRKQEQLSKFKIPQYYHDIDELERIIVKSQRDLEDANQRKKELGTPTGNKDVDYKRIHTLVAEIKRLKGLYCQEHDKYDRSTQNIWKEVRKYEADVEYSSKIRGFYQDQMNELRNLQSSFESLKSRILKKIE